MFTFERYRLYTPLAFQVHDPEVEFAAIDVDGGGEVLFIEFADWALTRHLALFGGQLARDEDGDGIDDGDAEDDRLARMAKRGEVRGGQRQTKQKKKRAPATVAKQEKKKQAGSGSGGVAGGAGTRGGGTASSAGSAGRGSPKGRLEKKKSAGGGGGSGAQGQGRGRGQGRSNNDEEGGEGGEGDSGMGFAREVDLGEAEVDFGDLASKLPTELNYEDKQQRKAMFNQFDMNGNGYLSLAEVDKAVRDVLGSDGMFNAKPAIMRAFQAAKGAVDTKSKLGGDYVEKSEFFLLLVHLKRYFELFVMFERVDTGDDRRINIDEFTEATWMIEDWGVEVSDPGATFASIDSNGGGEILFDELAAWALAHHLAAVTAAGDHEEEDDD